MVEGIEFYDETGNLIEHPLLDATSYVDVTFLKSRNMDASATVFCAIYNKDGRLSEITGEDYSFSEGVTQDKKKIHIDGSKLIAEGEVKVFVWQAGTMLPISAVKQATMATSF